MSSKSESWEEIGHTLIKLRKELSHFLHDFQDESGRGVDLWRDTILHDTIIVGMPILKG